MAFTNHMCLFALVTCTTCLNVNSNSLPSLSDDSVDIISLNESEYCFVNQTTIRVSDNFTSELQDIVNKTEHFIISTTINSTVIFIAPSNGSRCSSDASDTVPLTTFIILMVIYSCTILVAVGNIILHLMIKDLQTLPGVLVMMMCGSVTLLTVFLIGTLVDNFVVGANEKPQICITLVSAVFYLLLVYQAMKIVILFHFTHLMYKTYKMTESDPVDKIRLMAKYVTFVLVFPMLCFLLAMLIDFVISGNIYTEESIYCFTSENDIEAVSFPIIIFGEFLLLVISEIVLLSIGLGLYFLVNKDCCKSSTTTVKVVVALLATVGINIILLITLYLVKVPYEVYNFSATNGTLVEQIILFFIFLSSRKVRTEVVQLYRTVSTLNGSALSHTNSSFT